MQVLVKGLVDVDESLASIRAAINNELDVPDGFHLLDKRPMLKLVRHATS